MLDTIYEVTEQREEPDPEESDPEYPDPDPEKPGLFVLVEQDRTIPMTFPVWAEDSVAAWQDLEDRARRQQVNPLPRHGNYSVYGVRMTPENEGMSQAELLEMVAAMTPEEVMSEEISKYLVCYPILWEPFEE